MPISSTLISNEAAATSTEWLARWTVSTSQCDTIGITIDDGCFVVLYKQNTGWEPGTHIPPPVAAKIAELLAAGVLPR